MEKQIGLFEAVMDLLRLEPLFILGVVLVGFLLYRLFRKDKKLPKVKITISSLLLYYYLCIIFNQIVGSPTLKEFIRLASLGESFFNPNMNLIPLSNGVSLEFKLNILCFIPFGFLCPIISRTYERIKKVALLGLGLSLLIEISQLFTLYRATDINDLIANVLGTIIGCLSFKLIVKLRIIKSNSKYSSSMESDSTRFLPVLILVLAFAVSFIIG